MTAPITATSARKLMFPLTIAVGLLLWHGAGLAEVYKWVDENNEVQYTQTPPPPGIHSTRIGPAPPPADDPGTITNQLQERIKASEEHQKEQLDATEKQQQMVEIRKIRQQNCVAAHNNLEQLNRGGQVRYRTSTGEVLRLTEEDRSKRIEEASNQVKEFCES